MLVGIFRVSLCRYSSLVGSCDHSCCAMYAAVYITTGHARTVKSTRIYSRVHMRKQVISMNMFQPKLIVEFYLGLGIITPMLSVTYPYASRSLGRGIAPQCYL